MKVRVRDTKSKVLLIKPASVTRYRTASIIILF